MTILSWNCRGLGNPRTVEALRVYSLRYKPCIVFLIETFVAKEKLQDIGRLMGLECCFGISCIGRSGGLGLFWKRGLDVTVTGFTQNCIDCVVKIEGKEWRLSGYYGNSDRADRGLSWNLLRSLALRDSRPWCCLGDFNNLLSVEEKWGGADYPRHLINGFRDAVVDSGLNDVPSEGYSFTWRRKCFGQIVTRERLDRVMANQDWSLLYPNAIVSMLISPTSDHDPLLLRFEAIVQVNKRNRFRFDNSWLGDTVLGDVVQRSWSGKNLMEKKRSCVDEIVCWSKQRNAAFWQKRKSLEDMLEFNKTCCPTYDDEKIREEWSKICAAEDAQRRQLAKQHWMRFGDKNSKFFHAKIKSRRRNNRIEKLQMENGSWVSAEGELQNHVFNFFSKTFESSNADDGRLLSLVQKKLTDDDNALLLAPFSHDEIRFVVFQMHPDKAPGPDGLNSAFFQKYWNIIGNDVVRGCQEWLQRGILPDTLTDTLITLIPKKDKPISLKEFRPISLCNVLYKIFSKALANRLKLVLPKIISVNQSAFIPDRLITDNILVSFEMMHALKRRVGGVNGGCALKIDISKAYDRVNWSFLMNMMLKFGFEQQWVNWMRLCVEGVKYSILLNGVEVGPISAGRGLRQGDPLSPYLYLICAEALSILFTEAERLGEIKGGRAGCRCPRITHLLFADDSLFFFEANPEQANSVKKVLVEYEKASGQSVNFQKSAIFFSPNTTEPVRTNIKSILGVSDSMEGGTYLGLPSLVGRNKHEILKFLKDRVWKRMNSWSNRFLSRAGREVLLKSVIQAIPTYAMSVFEIPLNLCDEIQKMMNSFWWGMKKEGGNSLHWLAWNRMCSTKKKGGFGFRDLHSFNLALLGKQGWRLLTEHNTLFYRVFKSKYFHDRGFFEATEGSNPSFVWRSICAARVVLKEGIRWRVGNGDKIRAIIDPWIPDKEAFIPDDDVMFLGADVKVNELWVENERRWDIGKLMEHFNARDVNAILKIPISFRGSEDKLVWHYEKRGCYSVRTSYFVALKCLGREPEECGGEYWGTIWSLDIPPKMREFFWRCLRNILPTKVRLRERGVNVEGGCLVCGEDENRDHLFLRCHKAREVWRFGGFGEFQHLNELTDCLMQVFVSKNRERLEFFVALLWSLWTSRNAIQWQKKVLSASDCFRLAQDKLTQYKDVNKFSGGLYGQLGSNQHGFSAQNHHTILDRGGLQFTAAPASFHGIAATSTMSGNTIGQRAVHAPISAGSEDFFAWNGLVDGAEFQHEQMAGFGIVFEDEEGNFIRAMSGFYDGLPSTKVVEALALRYALLYASHNMLGKGCFFIDSQLVLHALRSQNLDLSEFGIIIADCKVLLLSRPDIIVRWVRRQNISSAHCLARNSIRHARTHIWEFVPSSLLEFYSRS